MDMTDFEIDPNDEDLFQAVRARLLEMLRDWVSGAGFGPVNAEFPGLMLTYKWESGDGLILRWTSAELEDFFVRWLDEQGFWDSWSSETIVQSVQVFFAFLADLNVLDETQYQVLVAHLSRLEAELPGFISPGQDRRFAGARACDSLTNPRFDEQKAPQNEERNSLLEGDFSDESIPAPAAEGWCEDPLFLENEAGSSFSSRVGRSMCVGGPLGSGGSFEGDDACSDVDHEVIDGNDDVSDLGDFPVVDLSGFKNVDDLLQACADFPPDMAVYVLSVWCGDRDPVAIGIDFAVAAQTIQDQMECSLALLALSFLGLPAEEGMRSLLHTAEFASAARFWLVCNGLEALDFLEPDEVPETFVETMAMRLAVHDATDVLSEFCAVCPFPAQYELIERLARVDHPNAVDVTEAFVHHHPDQHVVKAARKTLFKLRSGTEI